MRKLFEFGGLVAAVILIAFGGTAIFMGIHGGNTVKDSLKLEQITGTPDMTPAAIKAEAAKAGLDVDAISFPTKSVAGLPINTGDRARSFAGYMRIHTLEATGGVPVRHDAALRNDGRQGNQRPDQRLSSRAAGRSTTRPATSGSPRRR